MPYERIEDTNELEAVSFEQKLGFDRNCRWRMRDETGYETGEYCNKTAVNQDEFHLPLCQEHLPEFRKEYCAYKEQSKVKSMKVTVTRLFDCKVPVEVKARQVPKPKFSVHRGHTWDHVGDLSDGTELYADTTWGNFAYFHKAAVYYKFDFRHL